MNATAIGEVIAGVITYNATMVTERNQFLLETPGSGISLLIPALEGRDSRIGDLLSCTSCPHYVCA